MKISFEVPDDVAGAFKRSVPPRQRSSLVAGFLAAEARRRQASDLAACRKANALHEKDPTLDAWAKFDDFR